MKAVVEHITNWLNAYLEKCGQAGFVVGVSGGVDSALTATLCAKSGKSTILVNMPIRQSTQEYNRASEQIKALESLYENVEVLEVPLSETFSSFESSLPNQIFSNPLAMANSRSRLRMMTLYAIAQANKSLVVGTGNKVEDFGIGFFTKYGDGGVDVSPIADLKKTAVFKLAKFVGVVDSILQAKPTDGLWEDGRSDEDQIGAQYHELEWAMDNIQGNEQAFTERQKEVMKIYKKFHFANKHKMEPIPVCVIPENLQTLL